MKPDDRAGITYDLAGWKEIASVLCVSVRTAHRFKMAGMPIGWLTPRHVVASRECVLRWRDGQARGMGAWGALPAEPANPVG